MFATELRKRDRRRARAPWASKLGHELGCLVCAIGSGTLPMASLVPWALQRVWSLCVRGPGA
jgi:hypothetical protein